MAHVCINMYMFWNALAEIFAISLQPTFNYCSRQSVSSAAIRHK